MTHLVDVVTLSRQRLVAGAQGPVQLAGVVHPHAVHTGWPRLEGGGLTHRRHGEVRQRELELVPELGLAPPDHGAGLEVLPQLGVQLPLTDVTEDDEDGPVLAAGPERGRQPGSEVVSGPLLLEECVREDDDLAPGCVSGLDDGVGDILQRGQVPVIQTQPVMGGAQLQLRGQHLTHEHLVHGAVNDEHVKYLVAVHLVTVHPLKESDAVLVVQPNPHLVPVEEHKEDHGDKGKEGDDAGHKEGDPVHGVLPRAVPGLDVTAGHLPRLLTASPLVLQVPHGRLLHVVADTGHHLGVIDLSAVILQPRLEHGDEETVAGPGVLHQPHADQQGVVGEEPDGEVHDVIALEEQHFEVLEDFEGDIVYV